MIIKSENVLPQQVKPGYWATWWSQFGETRAPSVGFALKMHARFLPPWPFKCPWIHLSEIRPLSLNALKKNEAMGFLAWWNGESYVHSWHDGHAGLQALTNQTKSSELEVDHIRAAFGVFVWVTFEREIRCWFNFTCKQFPHLAVDKTAHKDTK